MSVIILVAIVLLVISAASTLIGSIGIIRMPDVYNRIHAETLCVVGGSVLTFIALTLIGIGVEELSAHLFSLKSLIIAVFLFVTNPVGSHAIARAAHRCGEEPFPGTVVDRLREVGG